MKHKLFTLFVLLALLLALAPAQPARAASTITVNSTADNTTTDGACTLREAVENAENNLATHTDCAAGSGNDTILFHSSLGTATITLALVLYVNDSAGLTIDGGSDITLSGNDSVQVFHVNPGALLALQSITVSHGYAATMGGGIYIQGGTLAITNSVFSNNRANYGGGVFNDSAGTLTITNSTFSNNSAANDSGGGVYNVGTLTITHSTFSNNSATSGGGGVNNGGGTATIANSTFTNNSAAYGGGVMNNGSTLTILNSTFSGNSATASGGALSTYQGGATPPTTTLRNTILANSATGVDCWNYATGVLIGGNNIIETTGSGSNSCSSITASTSDPMLGTLTGSPAYFPLGLASPAIDAGDDAICAAAPVSNQSQNGVTRPQGAHCDIGSYEKPGPATLTVNSTADNTTTDGACTLREAITNADNNAATHADCAAGSANDTILFHGSLDPAVITLTSALPNITDAAGLTISGEDVLPTVSGNDSVQVFHVNAGALLTLQAISVTHGSAAQGGGLENHGTVTLAYSTFSNNNASTFGGGIYNSGAMTVTHSTFLDNSAYNYGGGIYNVSGVSGTLTIANSTFSGNSAYWGGGVQNGGGTLTIANSTFSGNSATWGGGVATNNPGTPPTTTIRNTVLANSTSGGDCGNNATGTLIGDHNIIESTTTCTSIATLTSDPKLGALTNSPAYFPLDTGSPAINAGEDAICAAAPVSNQSQNGRTRPQGAHCDIGSFEANATLTFRSSGTQDGWVLETGENTNKGGTTDSASTTLRLGDDSAKKQYRSILSFATGASLPDNAVITKVTLKVKKQGITGGGNPVATFQGFLVDIKKGTFGTSALQATDFQATAKQYGAFNPALAGGWYSIDLTAGKAYINKLGTSGGLTQIRLRFKLDDNNNATANYLSLHSGGAGVSSRPQLIIEYYVP